MPETPKSFEEWFENWYDTHSFSTSRQAAWDAWNAALSLSPQAAAVPVRQDAVPEKEKEHACPDWDGLVIDEKSPEFECCTCFPKATQGTAVGEGEREFDVSDLPPLRGMDAEAKDEEEWYREAYEQRIRQLRQAIAQRDEAIRKIDCLRVLVDARGQTIDQERTRAEIAEAALDVPKPSERR